MARQKLKLKEKKSAKKAKKQKLEPHQEEEIPKKKAVKEENIVKTSYKFKLWFVDEKEYAEMLDFFNTFGEAVKFTLAHIKRVYDSFERLPEPIDKKCEVRKGCSKMPDPPALEYKGKDGKLMCRFCFNSFWSMQRLTLKDNFLKDLIEAFPELSPAHKGYYAGVIKFSVPVFKSWLSKVDERNEDIERLLVDVQAETNPLKQLALKKILEEKQKGIKDLEFRKNVIYLGNAGMFELLSSSSIRKEVAEYKRSLQAKKTKDAIGKVREAYEGYPELEDALLDEGQAHRENYYIGFTSPVEKRAKRWYSLRLGEESDYTSEHNKIKLVKDCIADTLKKYRSGFGKLLLRKDGKIEFMFPKEDISTSMTSNKEIEKFIQENPENPVVAMSFGIRKPISIVAFRAGKLVEKKTFGSPLFWHRINRGRKYRDKIARLFSKRYGKWHKRKARRNFKDKRGNLEQRFIRFYCHKLTRNVISHIKRKYPNAIVVMQDLKNIKKISYPSMYRVALTRWAVEMQRSFLEYKEQLKNLHTYLVAYRQSNDLKCAKCGAVAKNEKKIIKSLTVKLNHGLDKTSLMKHRIGMLKEKISKLLKYPQTKDNDRNLWIQQTSTKLTKYKNLLLQKQNGIIHAFKCSQCGFSEDFYTNDARCLYNKLIEDSHAQNSERMRDEAKT